MLSLKILRHFEDIISYHDLTEFAFNVHVYNDLKVKLK